MEPLDKKAKSVKACETCKKPFGLTKLRHTCKRCNKVICADCYKGRIKIVTYDLKAAHKVCYACEKEHNFQVNFKTSNQTSWNTLSKIGQKWLAACNPKQKLTQQSQEGFEESYKGYLDIVKSPYFSTSNNYFAMIDRDIAQGRLDRERTNYSFQEFLYYNQAKVTQEQVRASMANVLKAFIVKFPEIGYCQGMNYVCMFLLCLMDEESAFWTLGYVVANLVPVNFYGQSDYGVPLFGFQQEKFVLSNLIKEHLQLDSDMAQKITTLLDVHGASLLAPLLANFSNFEVLYETWNMMLTNNSMNEIRKVIISMMKLFLPKLKQKSMINPVEFQIMVIRLFNSEEFKDAQSIQIDDEHVRFLEAKFKGDHSNWQSHETKIHYTMRRALKFNKDQIRSMKERFDKLLGTRPRRSTSKMNLSMAEDPEGVAREDFRKLLTDVLSNDPESKGFMESLDVDALYDSLDSDNCGVLDFKEFLFLISMMLKGSFEEKLQSAFYVFDSGDKGVLTSNEFDQFLQVLVQTTVQANQDNITPFFNQDLENFNEKMASITNDKEKINFDMIRKELFSSNFIKYSEVIEKLGQQNDGTSKRNTMTKDPNFDTSILHTNQTYMDSTQDTTHLTHHTHHKADDLTRILDHSQSTILEESKYEEDKPNDDILTEAQKEKILVEEKAPEPVKKEEEKKAGVIEEVEADGTRKSSKVEYTHTASAKSLIEKFNKNKQVASAMPPKKEPTTKLVGSKLADSDKKFGGQASFEKLFENSLVSSDSLTSFDDSDHRKQPELSFNFDEDKHAHLHPLANMSKPASIPFGRNFLSPLELSDVDIKPADMSEFTLSFLNNTSEFSPEHISVNLSLQIAKPFAENAYEPLALDSPAQKPVLDEWKLGFFESTNQPLLPISHLSQSSNTHNKPFHDNTMFALAPEHDFSLPPGLQMWKIDQIEHGDKPVKPVELVRPLQPLKKPISSQGGSEALLSSNILEAPVLDTLKGNGFEQVDQGVKPGHVSSLLKVIKKPFAEVGQYNPLPSQNLVDRPTLDISEGKLFGFFNTSDSIKPAAAQNISAAIKKPFHQSHLTPLPQSYPENASKFLEWKEGCFEVTEQRVHEMNHQKSMNHIQNPFSGGAYMAMESEERVFEAPFATNWKQDCFESFEKQPKQAEIVRILAPAKKPFTEGGYQPLARHERFFDAPVLEGWKEDCFGPIERPVQQIKTASPLQAVNKPFNDGFYHALVPEHQVLEKSTLTGWKEDCFSSTQQPAVPVQHLVHVLKPVRKPFSGGESTSLPVQEASIGLSLLHGHKDDFFTAHNEPAAPAQLAQTSKVIRKPFSGGESQTLHKETVISDIATLEWKEDCFVSPESPIRPSEKASLIPIARKPISGGAAQTLPKDSNFSDMITLEWKEDCFLSSESPLGPNEGVSLIKSIGRPFADGACQPLPPHEHSLDDSLLGGWKPDWLQGDKQLESHTDSTQPLKTKKKPIEEGAVYSNLKQEEGLLDASDLQSWTEELFHSTEKSIAPMDVDQPLSTNRKPFAEGTCQPLSKDDHLFDSISFEEELFSALEAQCQPMELVQHLERAQKPFEEIGYSAIQPQERGNDHPTLIGWTDTCFEANDVASAKIGIVQAIKHTKNPFTGGTCEAIPVDRRHFDDYELVGGWKEDCFSKEDVQVLPSEPSQTLRPVKKPFADSGCQALETGQGSMVSAPVSWKSDMFLQTDKQHSATAPVNKLQPVTKPIKNAGALVPLVQALPEIGVENTLFSHGDMNIFGAQDKASRPQSRPSEVPRAIQVNKPMFSNMARHLEADKGDSEIIFIVDNIDVVDSKVSPVKTQDLARTSKNAAKVERYLYGNHAEDQKPEESEIRDYLEARYPYFSQTDKALRPHQWPGYKELIPKVPKEIKFEHIEERKNDESGTTTVIVNSASGSNKSDDFEIVREHGEQLLIEREHSQEEHVVKASEKIVYEDDEEETAGDSMFINKSAIENDTIYTNIGESSAGKRKRNAFDLEADGKNNSSCKVCSLF